MHRRHEFTADTKRKANKRANGTCECHRIPWLRRSDGCGARLGIGNTFYEHITTDFHSSDNSLDNCACLSRTCWKEKTARHDLPSIAKTKRNMDGARGIRSRSWFPGSRNDTLKKTLRGEVVDRVTGERPQR